MAEFGMPRGVCLVKAGKTNQSSIKAAAKHVSKLFDWASLSFKFPHNNSALTNGCYSSKAFFDDGDGVY